MKQQHPDCPCCTCGQIELTWSDRIVHIFHNDHEAVACSVVNCALDHDYDRTKTGVPYGLPDALTARLAPIVAKHLSAVRADWQDHTVVMSEEQIEAFKRELVEEIKKE